MEEIEYLEEYEDLILPNNSGFPRTYTPERTSVDSLEALYKDLLGETCEPEISTPQCSTNALVDVDNSAAQNVVNVSVLSQPFQITDSNTSSVSTSQNIILTQEPLYLQQTTTSFTIDRATSSFPSTSTIQRKSVATVKPTLQRAYNTSKRNNSPPLKKNNLGQSHYQSKFVPPINSAPYSSKGTGGFKIPTPTLRSVKNLKGKKDLRKRKNSAVDPLSLDDTDELLDFDVEKSGCMDDFDLESDLDNSIAAGISDIDSDSLNLSDDYSDSNFDLDSDLSSGDSDIKHRIPYKKKKSNDYDIKEKSETIKHGSISSPKDSKKGYISQSRGKTPKQFMSGKEQPSNRPKIIAVENIPIRHTFTNKEVETKQLPTPVNAIETSSKRVQSQIKKSSANEKLSMQLATLKSTVINGKEGNLSPLDSSESTTQLARKPSGVVEPKSMKTSIRENESSSDESSESITRRVTQSTRRSNFFGPKSMRPSNKQVDSIISESSDSTAQPVRKSASLVGATIMKANSNDGECAKPDDMESTSSPPRKSQIGPGVVEMDSPSQQPQPSRKLVALFGMRSLKAGSKESVSGARENIGATMQSPRKSTIVKSMKANKETDSATCESTESEVMESPQNTKPSQNDNDSATEENSGASVKTSRKSANLLGSKIQKIESKERESSSMEDTESTKQSSQKSATFFGPKSKKPSTDSESTTCEKSESEAVQPMRILLPGPKSTRKHNKEGDSTTEESLDATVEATQKSGNLCESQSLNTSSNEGELGAREIVEPPKQPSRRSANFIGPKSRRPRSDSESTACENPESEIVQTMRKPLIGSRSMRKNNKESDSANEESLDTGVETIRKSANFFGSQNLGTSSNDGKTTVKEDMEPAKQSPRKSGGFLGPKSKRPTIDSESTAGENSDSETVQIKRKSLPESRSMRKNRKESDSTAEDSLDATAEHVRKLAKSGKTNNKDNVLVAEPSKPSSRKSASFVGPKSKRPTSDSESTSCEGLESEKVLPMLKPSSVPRSMRKHNKEIDSSTGGNSDTTPESLRKFVNLFESKDNKANESVNEEDAEPTKQPLRKSASFMGPKSKKPIISGNESTADEKVESETVQPIGKPLSGPKSQEINSTEEPACKSANLSQSQDLEKIESIAQENAETAKQTTRKSAYFIGPKSKKPILNDNESTTNEVSDSETMQPTRRSWNWSKSLRKNKESDSTTEESSDAKVESARKSATDPKSLKVSNKEVESPVPEDAEPIMQSPRRFANIVEPKSVKNNKDSESATSEEAKVETQQPEKVSINEPENIPIINHENDSPTQASTDLIAQQQSANLLESKSIIINDKKNESIIPELMIQSPRKSTSLIGPKSMKANKDSECTACENTETKKIQSARKTLIGSRSKRTANRENGSIAEGGSDLSAHPSQKSANLIKTKIGTRHSKENDSANQGSSETSARTGRKSANSVGLKAGKTGSKEIDSKAQDDSESVGPGSMAKGVKDSEQIAPEISDSLSPQPMRRSLTKQKSTKTIVKDVQAGIEPSNGDEINRTDHGPVKAVTHPPSENVDNRNVNAKPVYSTESKSSDLSLGKSLSKIESPLESIKPRVSKKHVRSKFTRRKKNTTRPAGQSENLVIFQTNKISTENERLKGKTSLSSMPVATIPPGEEKVTFSFDPKAFQRRPSVLQTDQAPKKSHQVEGSNLMRSPARATEKRLEVWKQPTIPAMFKERGISQLKGTRGKTRNHLINLSKESSLLKTTPDTKAKEKRVGKRALTTKTIPKLRKLQIRLDNSIVVNYLQALANQREQSASKTADSVSKSKKNSSPKKGQSSDASPKPAKLEKVPEVTILSKRKRGKRKKIRKQLDVPPKLLRSGLKVQSPESINLKLLRLMSSDSIDDSAVQTNASVHDTSVIPYANTSVEVSKMVPRQEPEISELVDQNPPQDQSIGNESESIIIEGSKNTEALDYNSSSCPGTPSLSFENGTKTPQTMSGTDLSGSGKKRGYKPVSKKILNKSDTLCKPDTVDNIMVSNSLSNEDIIHAEENNESPPIQPIPVPAEELDPSSQPSPSATGCLRIAKVNSISSIQFESDMNSEATVENIEPKSEPYSTEFPPYQPELISTEVIAQSIKKGFVMTGNNSQYRGGEHQTAVYQLPAFIVMKTKIVTRNELKKSQSNIPETIKDKVTKLAEARQEAAVPPVKDERPEFKDICLQINNLLGKNANYLKFASSSERLTRMNQILADNTLTFEDAQCTLKFLESYLSQRVETTAKAKSQQFIPIYDSQKKIIGYRKRTVHSKRPSSRDCHKQLTSHRISATTNNPLSISSMTNSSSTNRRSNFELITTVKELEISTKKEPLVSDSCDAEVIVPDPNPTCEKRVKDEEDSPEGATGKSEVVINN